MMCLYAAFWLQLENAFVRCGYVLFSPADPGQTYKGAYRVLATIIGVGASMRDRWVVRT